MLIFQTATHINFSFLILLFLSSCASNVEKGSEPLLEVNESFVAQPLGFVPSIENFQAHYPDEFTVYEFTVENIHDSNIKDKMITAETKASGANSFTFYKTLQKEIFFKGIIRTDEIKMKNEISVGMSKRSFEKKLKLPNWANIINICNAEQTEQWLFYFNESKLDSILYRGYLD